MSTSGPSGIRTPPSWVSRSRSSFQKKYCFGLGFVASLRFVAKIETIGAPGVLCCTPIGALARYETPLEARDARFEARVANHILDLRRPSLARRFHEDFRHSRYMRGG